MNQCASVVLIQGGVIKGVLLIPEAQAGEQELRTVMQIAQELDCLAHITRHEGFVGLEAAKFELKAALQTAKERVEPAVPKSEG